MSLYQQGDIVVVNFPFTDISQTKKRPALVISNTTVNNTGDYLLVQITSQVKNDGFSVPILPQDFLQHPLPLTSFVRIHKIFLLNESLIVNKATSVSFHFQEDVTSRIISLLS